MSEPFESEMLTAYLDGELSEAESRAFEAQLESDPALREELDALADVRSFLADHGAAAAPAGFLDDVLAAVEAEDPVVVPIAWYRRPFGVPIEGLAVAAVALLVLYVALPKGNEPGPTGTGAAITKHLSPPPGSWSKEVTKETLKAENKATSEGTVDPVANAYEPNDDVDDGVADLSVTAKDKAINEKLALPTKNPPKQVKTVDEIDTPAAPPVKTPAPTGQTYARVPYSYTLYTEDSRALYRLAAIAAKYRGEVTDADKTALEVSELTGTDAATVLVQIPAHALQEFGAEIGGLGNIYQSADNSMFAGDPVEVRVRVQLAGGAPEGSDQAPAATRKDRMQYDMTEIDETR